MNIPVEVLQVQEVRIRVGAEWPHREERVRVVEARVREEPYADMGLPPLGRDEQRRDEQSRDEQRHEDAAETPQDAEDANMEVAEDAGRDEEMQGDEEL